MCVCVFLFDNKFTVTVTITATVTTATTLHLESRYLFQEVFVITIHDFSTVQQVGNSQADVFFVFDAISTVTATITATAATAMTTPH